MDLHSVQPKKVSAGDEELPLAPQQRWSSASATSQAFFQFQTSAKPCFLPVYKCLHLFCPPFLHRLGPKSPCVRKQGNVAAFCVSVMSGCSPASPLTVTHPATFTPPAYLPLFLCQVRPWLHYLVALPQKYSLPRSSSSFAFNNQEIELLKRTELLLALLYNLVKLLFSVHRKEFLLTVFIFYTWHCEANKPINYSADAKGTT